MLTTIRCLSEPVVSVVVSTFNRPDRLRRMLDGLRAQTLDPGLFEVVVVDDGSAPATAEMVARAVDDVAFEVRTARHPARRGPAAGRNTGWRMAVGQIVAFTDDDCVPTPGWLAALLAAAGEVRSLVVQGPTVPDPKEWPGSRLFRLTVENAELGPQYQTCNIAYPRAVLEMLGGFNEALHVGEDVDLAWRALERGEKIIFARDALVHHAVVRLNPGAWLVSGARWGGIAPVFADHPGARAMLHWGLFWNVWHMLLLRSLLALAGPVWLRRLVLARHVRALKRRARTLDTGPWAIPALLLYDAVETVAIVRGAVRHRTPLL